MIYEQDVSFAINFKKICLKIIYFYEMHFYDVQNFFKQRQYAKENSMVFSLLFYFHPDYK